MARKKNPRLKSSYQQDEFDVDMINELKKCAQSAEYFIQNYVKIVNPTLGAVAFELHDYQREMVNAFQYNKDTIVLASRQIGKMLDIKELIPTPSGFVTMGEIQPGDYVLDAEGYPTLVTAVSPIHYDKPCYNVNFCTGETILAGADHLWEVRDSDGTKHVYTTQQIYDSYLNGVDGHYTVKTSKPLQLSHQNLLIDPYIFGTWIGEEDNSSLLTNQLRNDLQAVGALNNKHIPMQYLRASYEQRLALLQGIMDTAGIIDYDGTCKLSFTCKRIIDDCFHLICSMGLMPTPIEIQFGGDVNYTKHIIVFTPFLENIAPFRLDYKNTKVKHNPTPPLDFARSIIKIEPTASVPCKCIVVDNPDHLFLVGTSLIPTHNSVVSSAFLLWYAIFNFDKTVLIASNKNSNAMEMVDRIKFAYENLPQWLKPGIQDDKWNKHELGFDNNSRIVSTATSKDSGRGLAISLAYMDELGFVAPNIVDEFWTSMTPTLSTGGKSIITSTPNGDSNLFAQLWRGAESGTNSYHPIYVAWDRPPGRDEKFRQELIGKIGINAFAQEYLCEFLSSEALLLDPQFLAKLTKDQEQIKEKAVIKNVHFWEEIRANSTYLIGIDPATGNGSDYSVISIFSFPQLTQVAQYRSNTTSTNDLYAVLKNILFQFQQKKCSVYFSIENNGVGEGIISLFEQDESSPDCAEFISEGNKRGMTTTSRTKMKACVNFREMIQRNQLHIRSPILLAELKSYVRKKGAYAAMTGATDDCISAVLIVVRLIEEISTYEQEAFDTLYSGDFSRWKNDDDSYDVFDWDKDDPTKDDDFYDPLPFI